jgi:hypothetical protein
VVERCCFPYQLPAIQHPAEIPQDLVLPFINSAYGMHLTHRFSLIPAAFVASADMNDRYVDVFCADEIIRQIPGVLSRDVHIWGVMSIDDGDLFQGFPAAVLILGVSVVPR